MGTGKLTLLKAALALAAAVALSLIFATSAFADEAFEVSAGKTLAVSDIEGADDEIQQAIDYVAQQDDSAGWTIEVAPGEYGRFTVPHWTKSGITDLAIVGESRDSVVVNVLNEAYSASSLVDNGGINSYGANVTLRNMTVRAGTVKQAWDDAAISTNEGMTGGKGVSLTVDSCTLVGPGLGVGAAYGIFWACSGMSVTNCSISGFSNAIEYMNDGFNVPAGQTYEFTGNTIAGASFAFHGYMGGGGGLGEIDFSNNTVVGTDELRSKVIAQDNVADSFVVDIHDNTFENAVVGLVNLQDGGDVVSDVLGSNAMGPGCFYVEAIEPGTIEFYTTFTAAAEGDGYWALTGYDNYDVDWASNPGGSTAFIYDAVKRANLEGSTTLSITGIDESQLVKTFTWFKDGLYWVTGDNPYLGSLTICKEVTGEGAPADAFEFVVKADVADGDYACVRSSEGSEDAVAKLVTFSEGEARVSLKAGQSVEIFGLPAGTSYAVAEAELDNYASSAAAGDDDGDYLIEEGVISGAIDDVAVSERYVVTSEADNDAVVFTNAYTAPEQEQDGAEGEQCGGSGGTLAQTGDATGMAATGAGIVLAAAGAIALIARRRAA